MPCQPKSCPRMLGPIQGVEHDKLFINLDDYPNNDYLLAAMSPAIFGIAAGHVGTAKTELWELACVRVQVRGTRSFACVFMDDVANFLDKASIDPPAWGGRQSTRARRPTYSEGLN